MIICFLLQFGLRSAQFVQRLLHLTPCYNPQQPLVEYLTQLSDLTQLNRDESVELSQLLVHANKKDQLRKLVAGNKVRATFLERFQLTPNTLAALHRMAW